MCVCSELGLVKRLSQILHLCFFCAPGDDFELNCVIIDWSSGGNPFIACVCDVIIREPDVSSDAEL